MENNPYESPTSGEPIAQRPVGRNRIGGQELFGVVARAIGLYFILMGAVDAILALFLFGGLVPARVALAFDSWVYARRALEWALPGLIPFFYPRFVVRIAYRDELGPPPEDS